jgi:SAM-dependent methyltransferase
MVWMLGEPAGALAAELAAQQTARAHYLDLRRLMTRHERTVARRAVENFMGYPREPTLDLGCGVGTLGHLWPNLGLIGLDVSADLLREAGTGYQLRVQAAAEALPFRDASLGAVLALNVLHHVVQPDRAVAEIARVLRPGGIVVAVDPRRLGPIELLKGLLRRGNPAYAPTHRAFRVDEYARLFGAAGLEIERQEVAEVASLIVAAALDDLGVSEYLPAKGAFIGALESLDEVLALAPQALGLGLNLYVRARR